MNTAQPTAKRPALTLDRVWIAMALALLALRPLLTAVQPHDFWWHLAMGRQIVTQRSIPALDSYSYTQAGQPFYDQSWLAQVLMYGLHRLGGVELLVLAQALVILLAYGLLLRLCLLRSGRLRLSVGLLLLSLPVMFDNWNIRPQSYALPLFAAVLTVVSEYRLGLARRLWLLPPLMALWANIHGSFALGLALIGLAFVGMLLRRPATENEGRRMKDEGLENREPRTENQEPRTENQAPEIDRSTAPTLYRSNAPMLRPLAVWGALAAAATLLNPGGPAIIGYVRGLLGSSAVTTLVTEWAPPTIRDTGGVLFFVFLLGWALALIYARTRPDPADLLICGALLWLALGASRNVIWFVMAALPPLTVQLATLRPPPRPSPPGSAAINAALVGMLALLVALSLPWLKPHLLPPPTGDLLAPGTPVQAVRQLQTLPDRPRRLFHAMSYGSYLIWAAPEQPVFIDPRIELYPYQQWRDYLNLGLANNVDGLTAKYAFDGMLLDKTEQEALIDALRGDPAWRVRFEDKQTVYLSRQ